ncbi:Nuclear transport factor 2 [Cordyceps fumosorosea ARSEF 2679]|uniref:Nuclear transport factor 2 n=1 Tax=Cordyceps fumosorosea (strain ARSEF 2679) TaxID=1081104 RepID=A0A167P8L1_CORFA|nr:Nuclear transport factor 2 [Cordyceps fumosorosea ARSEF 2679]OAA56397.1 Nuclear transport factor 2 [Cordyceps fumosorosea ARSEF 2679]
MSGSNLPDAHTQVQVSSEAADNFINTYYQAINSKSNLQNFYVNSSPRYPKPADISINGQVLALPADYLALIEAQGSGVHYDVESLDAHVLNPSFTVGMPEKLNDAERAERAGSRMSLAVTAVGRVRFGRGKEAPQKMFNETFVLVPNWDALARNPPRGLKKWLIMSQNFRAL